MQYRVLARVVGVTMLAYLTSAAAQAPGNNSLSASVTVFKDPNCGCCKEWMTHLRKHAFDVVARDTSNLQNVKRTGRVPDRLHSCHTAFVGGYVIEGHVPAADIRRLLKTKPKVAGIAVPGMPAGSPGMEFGNRVDKYDVIAFTRDGTTSIFARH